MKIVHIAPTSPYNEGWSYQDNLLPTFQKQLGHDVTIIITNIENSSEGKRSVQCSKYTNADGVHVIRKKPIPLNPFIKAQVTSKLDVYSDLCEIRPDFIFFHGVGNRTILQAVKYKRMMNPACVIVQDNHNDENNYNIDFNSLKGRALKAYFRYLYLKSKKYISRVYGVTPRRRDFAVNIYGVDIEKCDVLVMGADDRVISRLKEQNIRQIIRQSYGIKDDDFLVVTGGKIDQLKKIHILMEAVNRLGNIKLLVFGSVADDIKDEFGSQLSDNVKAIGWIPSEKVYEFFMAADLVCFPGLHSVFWEQACACKVPCLFRKLNGFQHVDCGGNAEFVEDINVDGLCNVIRAITKPERYEKMKTAALSERTDIFLYSNIAKKSLEAARCQEVNP